MPACTKSQALQATTGAADTADAQRCTVFPRTHVHITLNRRQCEVQEVLAKPCTAAGRQVPQGTPVPLRHRCVPAGRQQQAGCSSKAAGGQGSQAAAR